MITRSRALPILLSPPPTPAAALFPAILILLYGEIIYYVAINFRASQIEISSAIGGRRCTRCSLPGSVSLLRPSLSLSLSLSFLSCQSAIGRRRQR